MECIPHRIPTTAGGSDRQSSAATFLCVLSLIAYHKKWKVILTNFQEWNEIGICVCALNEFHRAHKTVNPSSRLLHQYTKSLHTVFTKHKTFDI